MKRSYNLEFTDFWSVGQEPDGGEMDIERLFTISEAKELLPSVRGKVEEMALAAAEMNDPANRLRLSQLTEANTSTAAIAPLLAPAEAVATLMAELNGLGIVIRDPGSGLIDFPSDRDGDVIYLCWRLGEDSISHWHTVDSGFAGRQPL